MTGAGAEKRAKKRAALREALRNRGGAPTAGEQPPVAREATFMPLVQFRDVADRLGLQSAKLSLDKATIRMALQVRGGMRHAAVIHAQVVPDPNGDLQREPSTPIFSGNAESARAVGEMQGDSPKEELQLQETLFVDRVDAGETAPPEEPSPKTGRHLTSQPSKKDVPSRVHHFNRPVVGEGDVMVPWRVTASHGQLRRSVTDLGTNAHTEMVTVYDGPRNVKDLRNFWGKKAGEAGERNACSKSELSMHEVQALLQRLLAAGNKTDFDEVRRLRKLIAEIE